MKDVKILIVEDEHTQLDSLSKEFKKAFSNINLEFIDTESDFITNFPNLIENPPNLIIMDVMLRWASEKSKIIEPPKDIKEEDFYTAGFRCLELIKNNARTAAIPVIIHSSAYDKEEIKEAVEKLSKNWIVVQKSSNRENLLLIMRSLLPNSLILSVDEPFREKLMDTVTLKPSFMGLSIDLKKIFGIIFKKKKKNIS